jgi:cobalt-zinc-cadmium efflux system membrane fusion protein
VQDLLPSPRSRLPLPLPRRLQWVILGAAALALAVLLVGGPAIRAHLAAAPVPAAAPAAAGTFRPTDAQWASLKLAPVVRTALRVEQVADGKIAIDDDHVTPVFTPYSGRVTRLIAKPGDFVERGAPLLALEASDFVQGQNDLIAAAAALNKARSQLKLAQINERRQAELYAARAGALKDWEQAQADLAAARNDARAAETALAAARNRLRIFGKSDADIGALESAARIDPDAIVAAPIRGTVIQRKVGPGQYINAGSTDPVFSIGDLSTVWLIANVRETDAPLVHVGQTVEVRVLAYPGRVFSAKIAYVSPAVDAATHRLPVRAEVDNADAALKPEMFASFSIIIGAGVATTVVPQEAVVYEGDTARVWVAQDDRTVASRQIRTGRSANGLVEVLAGVKPGESVVTSGTLFIDRAARGD